MAPTFRELLSGVKKEIREVSVEDVKRQLDARAPGEHVQPLLLAGVRVEDEGLLARRDPQLRDTEPLQPHRVAEPVAVELRPGVERVLAGLFGHPGSVRGAGNLLRRGLLGHLGGSFRGAPERWGGNAR